MPVNNNYTVVVNISREDSLKLPWLQSSITTKDQQLCCYIRNGKVMKVDILDKTKDKNVSPCTLFGIEFKETNFLKLIKLGLRYSLNLL